MNRPVVGKHFVARVRQVTHPRSVKCCSALNGRRARLRNPSLYSHPCVRVWIQVPGPSDRDTLQPWAARDWGPLQHMLVVGGCGEGMEKSLCIH